MKRILLLFLSLPFSFYSYSQCTWSGVTTDWNTGTNWTGLGCQNNPIDPFDNTVPTINDDVTIPNSGTSPLIDGENANAKSINIQALASLNMSAGSLTLSSTGVFTISLLGSFNMSDGDLYINKDVGAISDPNALVAGFVATGGTVHFQSGTGGQVIDANVTYPNIDIDGGALVSTAINLTVDDLTVTSNSTFSTSSNITVPGGPTFTIDAGSEIIITGAASLPDHTTYDIANGKVTVTGTNKDITNAGRDFTVSDLVINMNAGQQVDIDLNSDVVIANDLTITQGILDVNSGATLAGIANATTMNIAASGKLDLGGTHPFPTLFAVPTINSASTVEFYGTNQNVGATSGEITFGNLIINGTATKTLVNDITVAGNLDIFSSAFDNIFNTTQDFQITGGSGAISLEDDCQLIIGKGDMPVFTGGYTFVGSFSNTSEVIFNDENADQTISNAAHVFDNLTINGSNVKTIAHGISITDGGVITIDKTGASAVTLDANFNSIGGDFDLNVDTGDKFESGAVTPFAGAITETLDELSTFIYNGDAQNIPALDYGRMELSDDDGTESEKILVGNTTIDNFLTINDNVRLRTVGFSINGDASTSLTLVGNAIFEIDGTDGDAWPTGYSSEVFSYYSTVDYGSTITQVIADKTYGNLTLSGNPVNKTIANGTQPKVRNTLDIEDDATLVTNGPTDGGTDQMLRLLSTGDAANQTAKIADLSNDGGGTITGTGVICERDMDLTGVTGWNDWASPIVDFRLASWYYKGWPMTGIQGIRGSDYPSNPFCSVLTYDATISTPYVVFTDDEVQDKNDGWVRGPSITTLNTPGTGFRLYTGNRDRELEDIGLPAQGTLGAITLNYEGVVGTATEEGWNLIGNPYMCTIDFDALNFSGVVNTDYEDGFWVYSNAAKSYYVYKTGAGVGTYPFEVTNDADVDVGLIASHKAFWVKAKSVTPGTLTFEENDKVTSGTKFIKNSVVYPKLRVQAQNLNNGFLSTGVIVKVDDAKNTVENYDAGILKAPSAVTPSLFFLSEEGMQLSIDAIPNNVKLVPMQIEVGVSGDFELRFWDFDEINSGSCIWLEDKFTQEWFDLREEQSIVRTLSDTTTIARFNIHINPILNTELVANATCFGTNDGEVLVENLSENVIGLALYNASGAVVYQDMVTNNKVWKDLSPGVYTVREMNTNIGCPSAYATVEVFEPEEIKVSFEKSKSEIDLATEEGSVDFVSKSTGGTEYIWYFSDNNDFSFGTEVTHEYLTPGVHDVSLLVHNGNYDCAVVYEDQVLVKSTVGISEELLDKTLVNATVIDGQAKLNMSFESPTDVNVLLFDMTGKELGQWNFEQVSNNTEFIDLPTTKGIYLLKVQAANKKRTFKLF